MSHQSELIASDIRAYLHQQENKELLRLLTCGSVDDGKSTLIGRLLHDSKMIYEDQLAAITRDSKKVGTTGDEVDLALLVDGLQAEREQGITIDVAYRYFSTDKRKFIIADTPGHEQYTRNMATGASTCDLAIILIDARHGVQVQTRRHSFIVSLLGIRHVIVAINKMDLVDFSEARFNAIKNDYLAFAQSLDLPDIHFAPISALAGDNVVNASERMPWYSGAPLLRQLEEIRLAEDQNFEVMRFPVQYVNRPNLNFRGYCGTLSSGEVHVGDAITVLPSGKQSRIKSIVTWEGELTKAFAPMAITLTLEDEIDISRGDLLVHSHQLPKVSHELQAHLVWMDETPLNPAREYEIKIASRRQTGRVSRIHHRIDVNTLAQTPAPRLELNEIARVSLTLETPVVADDYRQLPGTGAFILVDRLTHRTVAAGMVLAEEKQSQAFEWVNHSVIQSQDWTQRLGQKGQCLSLQGGHEDERLRVLFSLEKALFEAGYLPLVLSQTTCPQSLDQAQAWIEWLVSKGQWILTDLALEGENVRTLNLAESRVELQELVTELLQQIQ
ncbi:sulfate adenylyltransferase subunit CysN [Nitrincola tapanii]|uniref:Sulfate adenylyltransferase subunit 1 n=1 Tax=Nitrincola tapanii TaxID=1708751 RepID=A0A5A9W3E9_9GAMM|nr:sulfate adenylyltransferase subunit CysN [Nitrincola tapanii]KAA0875266.1 sulfate adenylyltransferase subunit CysN [Nitrincola tapanii]